MRHIKTFSLIQLSLALAACAPATMPAATQVPPADPGAATVITPAGAPAGEPAAPTTEQATGLKGRALRFDQPFANAKVSVYALGQTTELATATTGADGAFSVALPAGQAVGTVYKIVARQDGKALVSLYRLTGAAAYRALDAEAPLDLSVATTAAFGLLSQRLEVLGAAHAAQAGAAAFGAFQMLAASQAGVWRPDTAATLLDAFLGAVNADGTMTVSPEAINRLGKLANQAQVQVFLDAARQIGTVLRELGGSDPEVAKALGSLGAIAFGNSSATSVLGGRSGGSGGNPPPPPPPPTVSGQVGVTLVPGAFATPSASVSGEAIMGTGAVLAKYAMQTQSTFANAAVDGDHNLWLPDYEHSQVLRVSPTGEVTPFPTPSNPNQVEVDGDGVAWVTNEYSSMLTRIATDGTIENLETGFPYNQGIVFDGAGGLWLHNPSYSVLIHHTASGNTAVSASGYRMTTDRHGGVWISNYNRGVVHYPADGSAPVTAQVTAYGVAAVAADADGNAWVVGYSENAVKRVTPAAEVTSFPTGNYPWDVKVGADGAVWVANLYDNVVTRIQDGTPQNLPLDASNPLSIALDPSGGAWIACPDSRKVVRMAADGTHQALWAGTYPTKLLIDDDGNCWAISSPYDRDHYNNTMMRLAK